MILQTDIGFYSVSDNQIRYHKWGCYMMVIFWFIVMKTKYSLDTHRIERFTKVFETEDLIKSDLYVNNPDKVYRHFGVNVVTRKENPYYTCAEGEFETLVFKAYNNLKGKYWYHRVAGSGKGIVTYDPYGYSKAVKYGKLISKRIHKEI